MKEMEYTDNRKKSKTILNQGTYKGYEYIVLSLNSHPCAYICLTKDSLFYKKDYDDIHIDCHGGLTFAEDTIHRVLKYSEKYKCDTLQSINRDWIIGWDYAHLGDYVAFVPFSPSDKKWTTQEITEECKQVINQLINEELNQFGTMIINEYEEWRDYECNPYITNNHEDNEELWEFVATQVIINGQTIEMMEDEAYERWKAKFDMLDKQTIWETVDECNHPYDPFREHCDADFYGI